jgi:hypothetical protein
MSFIILLIIVGVMLAFIPMDGGIRNIVVGIIAIVALVWLLNMLGFGFSHPLRVR